MKHNGYDYRLQEKINSASEYVDMICGGNVESYVDTVRGLFLHTMHEQGHERLCDKVCYYFDDYEDDEFLIDIRL